MELIPPRPRPMNMTLPRTARGLATAAIAAGLATLAGCGTYVASGATASSASANDTATGCASVNDATKVSTIRAMHLVEPIRAASMEKTDTNPTTVRALFRDFCQVLSHKDTSNAVLHCPMEVGLSYGGTFYDGSRALASYVFAASGCERVTIIPASAGAKPESTVVAGSAAAAAPSLHDDMAKTLGLSVTQVFVPYGAHVNQGSGPSK